MKNMKGFTLVELLAVIVILAIIALVTVPIILNTIEESRQGAAKDSAWGTIDAVKLAYAQAQTKGYTAASSTENHVALNNNTLTLTFGSDMPKFDNTSVNISGDKPTSGTITIDITNGDVVAHNLKFGNYYCNNQGSASGNTTDTMECGLTQKS